MKNIGFITSTIQLGINQKTHRAILDSSNSLIKAEKADDYNTTFKFIENNKIVEQSLDLNKVDKIAVLSSKDNYYKNNNNKYYELNSNNNNDLHNINKFSDKISLTDKGESQYVNSNLIFNLKLENAIEIKSDNIIQQFNKNRYNLLFLLYRYKFEYNKKFIINEGDSILLGELKDNHLEVLKNSSNNDLREIGKLKENQCKSIEPYLEGIESILNSSKVSLLIWTEDMKDINELIIKSEISKMDNLIKKIFEKIDKNILDITFL